MFFEFAKQVASMHRNNSESFSDKFGHKNCVNLRKNSEAVIFCLLADNYRFATYLRQNFAITRSR